MVSIEEAVEKLKRELIGIPGITGISYVGNTIIVYIESPEYAKYVPATYMGFPVNIKITGPIRLL